tara:strand:- start:4288 stop:5889 length:1602 start_codon:yes stop_codon:yes gene_type:complete
MNVTLKKQKPPVYAARRIIVRMIDKLGIEELKRRILQNLDDLYKMLQWNEANGIRVFRLSSEMFQHKNNKRVQDYSYDFAIPMLQKIGAYAREKGHRLTFHPGQFNNLGSNRESVIQQTLLDLEYHADVLDLMGMGPDSVMVIHGGGMYGDKPGTMKRWIANYNKLPDKIKRRLVLENCEKCYSIRDCLKMSFKCGVPVVLDTHHFECYKKLHPDESFKEPSEYIPFILDTWADKGIKPKFHVSEQGSGKIGHHSDYIDILPEYLLNIPQKYDTHIDIMIEAKMKELSIQKLYEKYPQCNCLKDNPYSICKQVMNGIVDAVDDEEIFAVHLEQIITNERDELFNRIKECLINSINKSDIIALKTIKGNTQITERMSIDLIRKCLESLNYPFEEAGSQQSKDFRNVNNIGLDIEVKKTDGGTIYFNDTLPTKNIYYIIFFTGKTFKTKESIPPQILFINGVDLIGEDMELALEYQKEIELMRDKWSRKSKGQNAKLFKYMSVCPRATYKTSIEHLLNSPQSFVLKEEGPHSQSA